MNECLQKDANGRVRVVRLTPELVDILAPEHGRTSCSDNDPSNGYYKIDEQQIRGVVVSRKFEYGPRCNRCFLLRALEDGCLDPLITVTPSVEIHTVTPEFDIVQK